MNTSSAAFISFALTFTIIYLALSANFNVDIVSSEHSKSELTAAINVVFVFPPKESYKSLVILESLYGIC